MMHLVTIVGLTVVLPIAFTANELISSSDTAAVLLVAGEWFVFWAVGIRLLGAGLRQVLQPSFTAETIFKIHDRGAQKLVTEIGFGNIALGLVAALSLAFPSWLIPSGLAGGLFLALAGGKHLLNADRTREENIAMLTDLFVALVVAVTIVPRVGQLG